MDRKYKDLDDWFNYIWNNTSVETKKEIVKNLENEKA